MTLIEDATSSVSVDVANPGDDYPDTWIDPEVKPPLLPAHLVCVELEPRTSAFLDALAKDFVESKFDVRRLMKSILISDAYQLSSKRAERQPREDRLFAHA